MLNRHLPVRAGIRQMRQVLPAFVFMLCLPALHSYAQNTDSLKALLLEYKLPDTAKVNILIELGNEYQDMQPDSMIACAFRALALATKNNYYEGVGKAYYQAGVGYTMTSKLDSSLIYYNKALKLFHEKRMLNMECKTLDNIGVSHYRQQLLDSALADFKNAVAIAEKQPQVELLGRPLFHIGDVYRDKALYTDALNAYYQALNLYEKHDLKNGIAESYRDIADIYSLVGNFKRALECINKSSDLYKASNDIQAVLVNYMSTASVYGQMRDFTKAIENYKKSLRLADSMKSEYWLGVCMLNVGECYMNMDVLDTAVYYYNGALKYIEKSGDKTALAYAHRGLGGVFLKKKNTTEAIKHLMYAYNYAEAVKNKREIFEISDQLSHAYEQGSDYRSALKYSRIYQQYMDTLFNEDNLKRIEQLQKDYELNSKDSKIKLLSKDNLIRQRTLEKQHVIVWALVIGLGCFAVIASLLVVSRRATRRNEQQVIAQRDAMQQQARQLEDLNSFKDKTFSVLSHDLKGSLSSFTSAMALLDDEDISQDEIAGIRPEINRQLTSLNMLIDNLLNWSKSHMQGQQAINRQQLDIKSMFDSNIVLAANLADRKKVKLVNNVAAGITAYADQGQIDVVIRNLLNNALKFTNAGGSIVCSAVDKGSNIEISVADTGVGMNKEQLSKLFRVANENSTYGTGGEKGVGLGLLLCSEFIRANNGTINASSEPGKGSIFTFTLPKTA